MSQPTPIKPIHPVTPFDLPGLPLIAEIVEHYIADLEAFCTTAAARGVVFGDPAMTARTSLAYFLVELVCTEAIEKRIHFALSLLPEAPTETAIDPTLACTPEMEGTACEPVHGAIPDGWRSRQADEFVNVGDRFWSFESNDWEDFSPMQIASVAVLVRDATSAGHPTLIITPL